nr:hypothetical protein [Actinospica acidiphila]
MAPAEVIRGQYSESSTTGPNAAPNPAQASATMFSSPPPLRAITYATTMTRTTVARPTQTSTRSGALRWRKAR